MMDVMDRLVSGPRYSINIESQQKYEGNAHLRNSIRLACAPGGRVERRYLLLPESPLVVQTRSEPLALVRSRIPYTL